MSQAAISAIELRPNRSGQPRAYVTGTRVRVQDIYGLSQLQGKTPDEIVAALPHITLAQEFDAADMPRLLALAQQRWREYEGPRTFRAETAAFVQNTSGNCWLDLAEFTFGLPAPVRKLRK